MARKIKTNGLQFEDRGNGNGHIAKDKNGRISWVTSGVEEAIRLLRKQTKIRTKTVNVTVSGNAFPDAQGYLKLDQESGLYKLYQNGKPVINQIYMCRDSLSRALGADWYNKPKRLFVKIEAAPKKAKKSSGCGR